MLISLINNFRIVTVVNYSTVIYPLNFCQFMFAISPDNANVKGIFSYMNIQMKGM